MPKTKEVVAGYSYQDDGHRHMYDGKRMTGVTTVLGVIAKPALIGWAANMAVDYVSEKIESAEAGTILDELPLWLEEARKAHTRKKESAGDIGKTVHAAIEDYIKRGVEPTLDEQGMKMFGNFKKWVEDNKVKFLESEKHVYSKELFIGGICDAIIEIDGQKWIYDWKTGGNRVYPEAFWQCAAYEILMNEMGEHKDIVGYGVLGVFKDGTVEEKRSTSKEDLQKAFLACVDIYRIQQKTENQIL